MRDPEIKLGKSLNSPPSRCEITYLDISLGCPLVHATKVRTIGEAGFVLLLIVLLHTRDKMNKTPFFSALSCLGCVSKLETS